MTVQPIGKIGGVDVALGANGTMLLAIVLMQALAALRWLALWVFDSTKKKEAARDELLSKVAAGLEKLSRDIDILKHTMHTDEDIQKVVRLELYSHRDKR